MPAPPTAPPTSAAIAEGDFAEVVSGSPDNRSETRKADGRKKQRPETLRQAVLKALLFLVAVPVIGILGTLIYRQWKQEDQRAAEVQVGEKRPRAGLKEAEAILRSALDSWSFGDREEEYLRKHPEVNAGASDLPLDWSLRKVLLRYEITASRKAEGRYEFTVILVFQSEAGTAIKNRKTFQVIPLGNGWSIIGKAGSA